MRHLRKSFTLIEILVVIVVVGILSAFILVGMSSITKDSRDSRRTREIVRLRNAIWSASNMGVNGYPTTPILGASQYANSGRVQCCLGTGDTNCTNIESAIGGAIPKDPSSATGSKEYCYFYKSDGTTFDIYAKLEGEGSATLSESSVTYAKDSTSCGTGWINTGLGFCVMQYEAKNVGGIATSQAASTPWINVSLTQAQSYCKAIGAHLINNAEWMAIARDAESVSSNWNGSVMYRGHTDNVPANSLASDGADPYYGTGQSSPSEQRRTLTLSNGQTIWDIAGNVWEWVDYSILTTEMPTPRTGWLEFNQITNWGVNLGYDNAGPKDKSKTGSNGVGRIYADPDTSYSNNTPYDNTVHTFIRGGSWDSGAYAGAFALNLYFSPAYTSTSIGFRCAR
jgi:prepilin-type N-terminal cleavage/methylation domain-containing protein